MLIFLSTVLIWVLTDTTRNKRKMVWRGYDTKATALLQQCCHIKNQSKRTFDHLKKTSKKKKKRQSLDFIYIQRRKLVTFSASFSPSEGPIGFLLQRTHPLVSIGLTLCVCMHVFNVCKQRECE